MNFFFGEPHKKRFDCYRKKRNISTQKKQNESEIVIFFRCENFMFQKRINGSNLFAVANQNITLAGNWHCRMSP